MNRNGKVARLESLVPNESMKPSADDSSRKRKHPEMEETTAEAPVSRQEQWSRAQAGLTELVGDEAASSAIALLQHWHDNSDQQDETFTLEKFYTLPAVPDKDARRALHELIRLQLAFCALADTHDGRVRIWHKQFEKAMPNYGKFDRNKNNNRPKKVQWPSDRPDYLQFTMYKENMDTSFACKEIVRRIPQRKVRIGYAGMKDKRGVTTQFCTLYRQEPHALAGINKGGRGGGDTTNGGVGILRVGNFEYVPNELQLGMLNGNRFDVVLRNVDVPTLGEDDRIAETKICLEDAAVALRERGFINYFGMQRFGKYYDTHKVGICILKGDYAGAVDIIMEPKPDELPRIAKARELWSKRFHKPKDNVDADARENAERDSARDVLRHLGRFMNCEISILNSLVRKPCDYRRAFGCIPRNMRMMFLHAVQSFVWNHAASFRIDTLGRDVVVGDLVLIEDKSEADGGSGTSGLEGKSVRVVDKADIASKKYDMADVVLPMVGTKMQYPENESGSIFDSLLAKHGITKQQFGKVQDRELTFKGDYRKLVCKPADVDFEIHEYTDPLEPLIKTDLMKLEGVELDISPSKADRGNESKAILLGMAVGFTLPPSAYATITLRELMKRPTSSDYQRQLKLEGPCEREPSSAQGTQDSS